MELLTIPTDSTYKFAAITGLAMILGATWVITTTDVNLKIAQAELEYQLEVSDVRAKAFEKDFSRAESTAELKALRADVIREREGFARLRRDRREKEAKALAYWDPKMVRLCLWCGAFWLIWGSVNWHRKIQLPQDILIKEQIEALKRARLAADTKEIALKIETASGGEKAPA
ncbi:MAG: hypothetical protein IT187_07515 [Geothrix sp.]|nr:hypothetical protein [Geothrix sp.]